MAKLETYKQIKPAFGVEKYLTLNIDRYEKSLLSQLRYGILPLRIETGRFVNEKHHERLCTLCNSNLVEDTEHFLFHCKLYDSYRLELDNKARSVISGWDNLSCIEKLCTLFN